MKLIGQIVALFFGIALISVVGFGAYLAFEFGFSLFERLESQVAIVTAIACAIAAAFTWVIARAIRAASQQSKGAAIREEKTATYQLFLDCWETLFRQDRARMDQLPVELAEKLKVLERLLALYGGAAVLKAHTSLRSMTHDKGVLHPHTRALFGEAMVAIRKDLGSDAPRNIAAELERLLLPVNATGNDVAESKGARGHSVAAPTS